MNKEQLALAIESVSGDCDGRGEFKDWRGQTCAVGGLAESAGFSIGKVIRVSKLIEKVRNFYGLTGGEVWKITDINDKYKTKKARQSNVIKYLKGLVKDE